MSAAGLIRLLGPALKAAVKVGKPLAQSAFKAAKPALKSAAQHAAVAAGGYAGNKALAYATKKSQKHAPAASAKLKVPMKGKYKKTTKAKTAGPAMGYGGKGSNVMSEYGIEPRGGRGRGR